MKNLSSLKLAVTVLGGLLLQTAAFAAVPQAYGAIAYSPTDRAIGIAQRAVNQEAAEQDAMGKCAVMAGGSQCRIVVWFYNACAALAIADNGSWGADFGVTTSGELMKGINRAFAKARGHCLANGGDNCRLEQSTCSFDVGQ
jgi:hypothetical protein